MRAFFDTNVLIAALLTKGVCFRLVRRATAGEIDGIFSPQVIREFERVARTRLHVPETEIQETLAEVLKTFSVARAPEKVEKVCRDPNDDAIIAAAVNAKADVLVTGDKDILVLGTHEGIETVPPAELLGRIEKRKSA